MRLSTTRRSFLKRSVLAGSATLVTPGTRAEGANSDLRVAAIGVRTRGRQLIDDLLSTPATRLVAVCDVDPEVLEGEVARLAGKNIKVASYADFRTLCEAKDIDAVVIATPNHTHALIAITAAVGGKHAYVETPVSHNVWEGQQMVDAAAAHGVTIHHGHQRRCWKAWRDAFNWLGEGPLGKLKLARGICYQLQPSIGRVKGAQLAPEGLDYDLWCGPRARSPILRKNFHHDWRWQFPWGNGEIGSGGAHLLDLCRWALGDPQNMPQSVISCGNRFGTPDNGDWPNTQLAHFEYQAAPILIELRGLPKSDLDYPGGSDRHRGISNGVSITYEGGSLIGELDETTCRVLDDQGRVLKRFEGGGSPIREWITAIQSGRETSTLSISNGHLS
ncbi:MAG: Gfo/Idh/MocA family oxidoreductase, partial [Verrucomicrobiota bacterium]